MKGPDAPLPLTAPASSTRRRRLDSWKEIAAYLNRTVRTVQRWEREQGLPVHRLRHKKLGSAFAYPSELDQWCAQRTASPGQAAESESKEPAADSIAPKPKKFRRLMPWVSGLVLARSWWSN